MATTSAAPAQLCTELKAPLEAPRVIQLWHLASFDAPTVAAAWAIGFAWACRVTLPAWSVLGLILAAWSFYAADRLLDARAHRVPLRPRHHFHWRHRRIFSVVAVAAGSSAAALFLTQIPIAARARDSLLAAATLAYFSSVHSPFPSPGRRFPLRLPKELLVAILFTLACATPAWTRTAAPAQLLLPVACFIALAWLNCHAIESWESEEQPGRAAPVFLLASIAAAVIALAAGLTNASSASRIPALLATAAASAALLAILDRLRHRLAPTALRALADMVLLTPLALLAFR